MTGVEPCREYNPVKLFPTIRERMLHPLVARVSEQAEQDVEVKMNQGKERQTHEKMRERKGGGRGRWYRRSQR